MGTRQASHVLRETKVLVAARELFLEKGFENTSVREIAERAGVSVGTVANCGDKASLLARMFDESDTVALLGRFCALGPVLPDRSFADEMVEVFDAWFASVDGEEGLVRSYMVSLLVARHQRGHLDLAVVSTISRRLLVHEPTLDGEAAWNLAFTVYSTYCMMVASVLLGNFTYPEARLRAQPRSADVHSWVTVSGFR